MKRGRLAQRIACVAGAAVLCGPGLLHAQVAGRMVTAPGGYALIVSAKGISPTPQARVPSGSLARFERVSPALKAQLLQSAGEPAAASTPTSYTLTMRNSYVENRLALWGMHVHPNGAWNDITGAQQQSFVAVGKLPGLTASRYMLDFHVQVGGTGPLVVMLPDGSTQSVPPYTEHILVIVQFADPSANSGNLELARVTRPSGLSWRFLGVEVTPM